MKLLFRVLFQFLHLEQDRRHLLIMNEWLKEGMSGRAKGRYEWNKDAKSSSLRHLPWLWSLFIFATKFFNSSFTSCSTIVIVLLVVSTWTSTSSSSGIPSVYTIPWVLTDKSSNLSSRMISSESSKLYYRRFMSSWIIILHLKLINKISSQTLSSISGVFMVERRKVIVR